MGDSQQPSVKLKAKGELCHIGKAQCRALTIMLIKAFHQCVQATLREVREAWQGTAQQLQQREAIQVQQVGRAVQQLREDLQQQLPSGKLKAIESKLAALEGSVLSAGPTHLPRCDEISNLPGLRGLQAVPKPSSQ